MKPYLKDSNGDKRSPINGRIKGLFFSANVDFRTGQPPTSSPYGSQRLHIIAHELLNWNTNLYFADFYCRSQLTHHVTLVITKYGSTADKFCAQHLYELDKRHNLFVRVDGSSVQVTGSGVWVELLYTENVDIDDVISTHAGRFSFVTCNGRAGALSKSQTCPYCNIAEIDIDSSFANLNISRSELQQTLNYTGSYDTAGRTRLTDRPITSNVTRHEARSAVYNTSLSGTGTGLSRVIPSASRQETINNASSYYASNAVFSSYGNRQQLPRIETSQTTVRNSDWSCCIL